MNKRNILLIASAIMAILALPLGVPWLTCTIYVVIIAYCAYLNNETTLICFCVIIVFQNIILIIFSKYISGTYMVLLLAIKELLIYLTVLRGFYLLIKEQKIGRIIVQNKINILFLLILFISILVNSIKTVAGISSVIFSIRQMCIPIICFMMGYFLRVNKKGFDKVKRAVIILTILLVITGIVEMLLPENKLWQKLNYNEFLEKKQRAEVSLFNGVTVNFYTWDFGILLRRLVSITADPLATSHLILIGLFTQLFLYRKNNKEKMGEFQILGAIILLTGGVLGFSKGAIVYLLIFVILMIYHKFFRSLSMSITILLSGVIFMIAVSLIYFLYSTATHPTAITNHIDGLYNGIKDSTIFGNGMGTVGAANSAITGVTISNSESFFGVCLNQIGYIGMTAMTILWIRLILKNVKRYFINRDRETLFMIVLLLGLTVDMILSESSVAIIGTGIYFIYIGIIERNNEEKRVEKIKI